MTVTADPCPFCSGTAHMRESYGDERTGYHETFQMRCTVCGATTAAATYQPFPQDLRGDRHATQDNAKGAALAAWNRRTPTT